ncbi:restriction endonuclease subunit S [Vibrio harveyi]
MNVNKPIGAKDLPEDWKWLHLEDLCSRVSVGHVGETNSHFCGEEGVPFLRSQNIRPGNVVLEDVKYVTKEFHQKSKKSQLLHGDIAIVRVGQNRGDCAVIPPNLPEVNCANIVFARLSDIRYSEFIGAFFNTSLGRESLLAVSTGSAQGVLNTKSIAKVVVPVPPLEKAYEIGNVYKSFSDKLELNSQTNQTLEQMAQAIFKSWFVDFEPVKAKMNGEQLEGMDEATASLFPEKLDSETDIPEGWRLSEIGDEVAVVGGGTPSKKNDDFWVDGHIHWTSPKDLSGVQDKVLLDTASKLTEAGLKKVSSGLLPVDTVLLSSRAPVGYLALAKVPLAVNQGYIAMKCEKVLPPEFVLQWCVHRMDEIKQRASGSTFAEISKKNFKPISVVVPSEDVLNAYQKLVKPLYDAITSNARQSEQLSTLRDTLLPKLLSGEIELQVR